MVRILAVFSSLIACAAFVSCGGRSKEVREWTVMVYLNGDNDLECPALDDFSELAGVPDSDRVKVVVQLDRGGKDCNCDCPPWSETHRFEIIQGKKPTPQAAVQGLNLGEINMASGAELRRFVVWAQTNFPAQHYLLLVSDHGDGWRTMRLKMHGALFEIAKAGVAALPPVKDDEKRISAMSTMLSMTMDDSDESDQLYVTEAVQSLQNLPSGRRIDIVAFESCLMSMVETAYAFRHTADFLVGSENESDRSSWKHGLWLQTLVSKPEMSPAQLAARLVTAYTEDQGRYDTWTLSAIRLDRIDDLAKSISGLASALEPTLDLNLDDVIRALRNCEPFGHHSESIDLGNFCNRLEKESQDRGVLAGVRDVRLRLAEALVEFKTSSSVTRLYHASGLGIFFPKTDADFITDRDHQGYLESNQKYPVSFVRDHRWDDFLLQFHAQRRFQKK